jgi:hypothetical protein
MARRTRSRFTTLLLACGLALSACTPGPASPTPPPVTLVAPSPTPAGTPRPAAVVYAEIRELAASIRGLEPTADVDPVVIDEAQLRDNLETEFDTANPPARLLANEQLLISLGLLPPGASLRALTLDLQAGQVAGYYSPERDQLFVVSRSGGLGPVERVTYAHEFTHQLQDQHYDLGALDLDAPDAGDRSLGRLALIEGDASSVQQAWMEQALTPAELGAVLTASLDPAVVEPLTRAPRILVQTVLFPYTDGLGFVNTLLLSGGYDAVDAAYANLPASTEQVLHPRKYLDGEEPLAVDVPDGLAASMGTGWAEGGRDTLGELILRTWLREGGATIADAAAAAAGWGGDRAVLLRGPSSALAVAVVTEWDSVADAAEFANAAAVARSELGIECLVVTKAGSRQVALAIGDESATLALALGR